jgi:hypothetical protein
VVTGSMNWSASGDEDNDENTLIIHNAETAQAYVTAYQALYEASAAGEPCVIVDPDYKIYLPLIVGSQTAQPIPTATATVTGAPPATATPTATPTTPAPTAQVQITFIEYNPDGDDVLGEFVRIENTGSAAQGMTGWTLRDESAHIYTFPSFTLPSGGSVQVWTKIGTDTATDLYWGSGAAIWNNTGDTATLQDDQGQSVDSCGYVGGGTSISCP